MPLRDLIDDHHRSVRLAHISAVLRALTGFVITLVCLAAMNAAGAAPANAPAPLTLAKMGDMSSGGLLLPSKYDGYYVEAPAIATDVDIQINGLIARTKVTQKFQNPSEAWVEGIYVFPLPDHAAVDKLRIQIGERFIEGQIKERQEARRMYETARARGQRASLVEQERPNMFTNSVANIGPGETIIVQIEYQESIRYDAGLFHLRFPMVVGPRFVPPVETQLVSFDGNGMGEIQLRDPVPDAERITPPVLHPAVGSRNPITLTVELDAGFAVDQIRSAHHDIRVIRPTKERARISFVNQDETANRDFELVWQSAKGSLPQAAMFKETKDGITYAVGFIIPPQTNETPARHTRETIFVIDNSGSMGGASIRQAKESLLFALSTLDTGDRFNVVRFDDTTDAVFRAPQPVTPQTLDQAARYISQLEAEGGTMMLPALEIALYDPYHDQDTSGTLRQVVFLTDGAIGNEAQLFEEIDRSLGRSRLFTVGIGSAPNSYFMSRAARLGRGSFTHIGSSQQVMDRMSALLSKLRAPVLTDLSVSTEAHTAHEVWPNPLPDLYVGEPVVFTARIADGDATFTVQAQTPDGTWSAELDTSNAEEATGVAKVWARNKIASLEERRFQGESLAVIDKQVLEVALDHHLVTRLTSLVAVDREIARPAQAALHQRDVPLNLPEGWDFDKVFGEQVPTRRADYATPEAEVMLASLVSSPAPHSASADSQSSQIVLPQGSTDRWLFLIMGLIFMAGGLIMSALQWREIAAKFRRELV